MLSKSYFASSRERDWFIRVNRLLIVGGNLIVRDVFNELIPPGKLVKTLNINKSRLLDFLNPPQQELLYPKPPAVSAPSDSYDISLLVKLLRNICRLKPPASGWIKLPPNNDKRMVADIIRIDVYRNEYAHTLDMALSNDDFSKKWKLIKEALLRLVNYVNPKQYQNWEEQIWNLKFSNLSNEDLHDVFKQNENILGLIRQDMKKLHDIIEQRSSQTAPTLHQSNIITYNNCQFTLNSPGSLEATPLPRNNLIGSQEYPGASYLWCTQSPYVYYTSNSLPVLSHYANNSFSAISEGLDQVNPSSEQPAALSSPNNDHGYNHFVARASSFQMAPGCDRTLHEQVSDWPNLSSQDYFPPGL